MKVQIEDLKFENEALKKTCQDNGRPALELLSAMTGLSVFFTSQSGTIQRFSCNIIDGVLKGIVVDCRSLWGLMVFLQILCFSRS